MKRLAAVLFASLALAACTRQVDLMSNISETEANEVIAALQGGGIRADKLPGKDGMVGVSIDSAEVGTAVDLLRSQGLPRERYVGMGQVFKKEGLISSPVEERARYLYALSQELGATLSRIDGVVVARVHVVLPERGAVGEPVMPSSAAVFIKYQEGFNLDALQPQIRRLVTNSIPGLTPEKISIVLFSTQPVVKRPAAHDSVMTPGVVAAVATALALLLGAGGYLAWRSPRGRALRLAWKKE